MAVDLAFLALNVVGEVLFRRRIRFVVPVHMAGLVAMIFWYVSEPSSIPAQLGDQAIVFAALVLLPNIILASLYGMRVVLWSAPPMLLGVWVLASTPEEVATAGFLVVVSGMVGGLFFHSLLRTLEAARRKLASAAYSDPMTGIGNRRALETAFAAWAATTTRPQDLFLSVWDVDGLKDVNDEYGHAAGDRYLRNFVRALAAACPEPTSLYRIGGDEFVGLHPHCPDPDQIVQDARATFPSVSVGMVAAGSVDLGAAMEEADARLYADKRERTLRRGVGAGPMRVPRSGRLTAAHRSDIDRDEAPTHV